MQITKTDPLTGESNTLELDVTADQFANWLSGELIQNAFPNLEAHEREFIKSGYTKESWDTLFGGEEEDEL